MTSDVTSNLSEFIVEELFYAEDISVLGPDEELLGSGLLDSIGAAQLVLHIESEFAVKLASTDLTFDNFNTLNALAALIKRRQ